MLVYHALQSSGLMLLRSFTGRSLHQAPCCSITLTSTRGAFTSSSWREQKPTSATMSSTEMCMRGTWGRKWLTTGNLTCSHCFKMMHIELCAFNACLIWFNSWCIWYLLLVSKSKQKSRTWHVFFYKFTKERFFIMLSKNKCGKCIFNQLIYFNQCLL